MKPLKILPKDQGAESTIKPTLSPFTFSQPNKGVLFTESGKSAIRKIAELHGLSRDDEACIITTSDSPFVSSCVTSTLFNFCKVSRVLTDKTRLLFVIHEFGFPCERIDVLAEIARNRGIPLVEDIAHSLTSSFKGRSLGALGDYAVYSLPKSLPLDAGGILLASTKYIGAIQVECDLVKNAFTRKSEILHWVHNRRRYLFEILSAEVSKPLIYRLTEGCNPFCFAYRDEPSEVISLNQSANRRKVELLRTHNPDWVTIPLNPWYTEADVERLIELVKGDK